MSLLDKASLIVTPNGYKASKLYSVVPSSGAGDLDVTRATIATRVNSLGLIESVGNNVPRIDYLNSTCPSLLVEPQRTNVLKYSEDFSNVANWLTINFNVSANTTTAPDGTSTADKLIPTTTNSAHAFYQAVPTGTYTFSIYAKAAEETLFSMWLNDFSKRAIFDLSTGTITSSNVTNSTITNVGNGWYRCTIYDTTLTSFAAIYGRSGNGYAGNGTDGMFFWGAQSEAASYVTSYIPTVASTVTRNADVISKTGISSLIGQSEGTLFFDGIVNNIQNSATNILNTNKDPLTISTFALGKIKATNKFGFDFFLGNGTYTTINLLSTNAFANGIRTKVAIRYKSGDFAMYVNGNLEATSSSTFTANGSKSELFLNDPTTYFFFQESVSYNSAQLYKTGLSNSELAQLTTI